MSPRQAAVGVIEGADGGVSRFWSHLVEIRKIIEPSSSATSTIAVHKTEMRSHRLSRAIVFRMRGIVLSELVVSNGIRRRAQLLDAVLEMRGFINERGGHVRI